MPTQIKPSAIAVLATAAVASFTLGVASADAKRRGQDPTALKLKTIACMSHCPADGAASVGSLVELAGKNLGGVVGVKFTRADGGRVPAAPESVSGDYVEVTVPEGAATGFVKVIDDEGAKATSAEELTILAEGEGGDPSEGGGSPPAEPADPGSGSIELDRDKGFFKSRRQVTASFDSGAPDTEIEVISALDDAVVATIAIETPGFASWGGVGDDGEAAPDGEYAFRLPSGGESQVFEQHDHIFPVRGKHSYGDGLGAGRDHGGQDILADCGKKVVAARAGRVVGAGSEGAMGNYLIVDGKKNERTYVYMHLQDAGELAEGDKVKTGQTVGRVGDTGNATTCHLHFEVWDGDWQRGQRVDPKPELSDWDEFS